MKLSISSTVAASVLCFGTLARAQEATNSSAYAAGLISALQYNNLTTLLSIAQANVDTLLPLLINGGNKTIFAPTNEAFAALPSEVTSNNTLVAQTVLYHIYYGSFASSDLTSGLTIARSALNATGLVNLPGGQGQVGVLTKNGTTGNRVTVVQALSNVTSVASARFQNLVIHAIPSVLTVPQSLTATASAAGLTSLVSALTENAAAVVPVLDSARGITVFAPVNDAFSAAQEVITTLNQSSIANVLLNHVINGTAVYSSEVADGASLVSAGGANLTFTANSTGVFVTSGNSTARIIRTDIPVTNGVVHLIDSVLANPESNAAAASSAASSAVAAGSTATAQPTGAVGGGGAGGSESQTATGTAPSGSASAPASGAEKVMVGGGVGVVLAVAGLLVL